MVLTKDAKKMLYELYKEYLRRRKADVPKLRSKNFKSAHSIQEELFPDMILEDVEETLRELSNYGLVVCKYASDTIYLCFLTDEAIAIMENQRKDTMLSVANFIAMFLP